MYQHNPKNNKITKSASAVFLVGVFICLLVFLCYSTKQRKMQITANYINI